MTPYLDQISTSETSRLCLMIETNFMFYKVLTLSCVFMWEEAGGRTHTCTERTFQLHAEKSQDAMLDGCSPCKLKVPSTAPPCCLIKNIISQTGKIQKKNKKTTMLYVFPSFSDTYSSKLIWNKLFILYFLSFFWGRFSGQDTALVFPESFAFYKSKMLCFSSILAARSYHSHTFNLSEPW